MFGAQPEFNWKRVESDFSRRRSSRFNPVAEPAIQGIGCALPKFT